MTPARHTIRYLCWLIAVRHAIKQEHAVSPTETPVSPEAAVTVAELIGRIHLEWHKERKAMGL